MPNDDVRLPKLSEVIIVLALFLIIMSFSIISFDIPLQLSLFVVWFLFIGFGIYLGHKYNTLQKAIAKGIYEGIEATLVIVVVGALIGTWTAGGIVPGMIYYGLSFVHPSIFLVAAMVICAVTALATGTSFGTVGTAGVAMMGVGQSFGIPLPLVAGAVLSGAYFGDKVSPLSDTTVLAASLSRVNVMDHVRSMLYVSIPSIIIAGILYLIVGFFYVGNTVELTVVQTNMDALNEYFNISWYMLVPPVVVIVLLALNKPAIPSLAFGSLLGVLWAWAFQGMDVIAGLKTAYEGIQMNSGIEFLDGLLNGGGIVSMLSVVLFTILALGFGGLLEQTGVLKVISGVFSSWVKNSTGKLTVSTVLTGFFGNLFGSAGYVSIITGCKMTKENYQKLNIQRRVLSRNTESGGTMTAPMIPWSDNGIFMAATLGVATISYLPFMWFAFIGIFITILYGYTGKFIWREDEDSEEHNVSSKETIAK
ncbi:Na+/H+ antiporter NhaC [Virgibacillus ainsalahensis]